MTLRTKLLLAQVPLVVALVVVVFLASANVSSLGRHSENILKDNYRSVLAAQQMKEAVERLEDLAVLPLIGAPIGEVSPRVVRKRELMEKQLRIQESNITESGEKEATQHLRQAWTKYEARLDNFLSIQDPASARAAFVKDLDPAFTGVQQEIDTILTINQDAIVQKSESVRRLAKHMDFVTIVASLAALLLGGVASMMFTSRLIQPFGLLTRTVHRLGEGDFEARVDISGHDELAQLAGRVNAMATRLAQYRRSSLGELLLAQQASQAAIDSLADPVVVFDLDGNILNFNRAADTLLSLGARKFNELDPVVRSVLEQVRSYVLGGRGLYVPRGFEEAVPIASPDGERYLLPRAAPMYAEEGGIMGATVVLQDITRLRRVDELRNDLVATVAHEFRTPLTSLQMAVHLCLERAAGPLTDKQADLLYAAREDSERLQSLVDELLDLARIQGGQIELHRRPTAPDALVGAAVDAFREPAEDHQIVLRNTVLPGQPLVGADPERVQLLLSNLLSNAIRHTPAGGCIELRAKAEEECVRFEVADSGSGIPAEYRLKVFEKFFRVPGTRGAGAGLGLSICREIVEAHGGEIGIDETPGGGATFWFTLPASESDSQEGGPTMPAAR
jgi:two-component system, NtrC family, sensor histidine kinase KinB